MIILRAISVTLSYLAKAGGFLTRLFGKPGTRVFAAATIRSGVHLFRLMSPMLQLPRKQMVIVFKLLISPKAEWEHIVLVARSDAFKLTLGQVTACKLIAHALRIGGFKLPTFSIKYAWYILSRASVYYLTWRMILERPGDVGSLLAYINEGYYVETKKMLAEVGEVKRDLEMGKITKLEAAAKMNDIQRRYRARMAEIGKTAGKRIDKPDDGGMISLSDELLKELIEVGIFGNIAWSDKKYRTEYRKEREADYIEMEEMMFDSFLNDPDGMKLTPQERRKAVDSVMTQVSKEVFSMYEDAYERLKQEATLEEELLKRSRK